MRQSVRILIILSLFLTVGMSKSFGQCSMGCTGAVNISIDGACNVVVDLEVFAANLSTNCTNVNVIFEDEHGRMSDPIPDAGTWMDAGDFVGKSVVYHVVSDQNRCWGDVLIEDKLAPDLNCDPNPLPVVTMPCCEVIEFDDSMITDCSGPVTINVLNLETIPNPDCTVNDQLVKTVVRTFTATDKLGNTNEVPCVQTIEINRVMPALMDAATLPNIVFPIPQSFDCSAITAEQDSDGDGIPDPTLAGADIPYIDKGGDGTFTKDVDVYLYPSRYNGATYNATSQEVIDLFKYCNMSVTAVDLPSSKPGCKKSVRRMWTVTEWFCNAPLEIPFMQEITITNPTGPTLVSTPHDIFATTNGYTCTANVCIPDVEVAGCFDMGSIDVFWANAENPELDGSILNFHTATSKCIELKEGMNVVRYVVTDACHDSNEFLFNIIVEDSTPPVAICEAHSVISITGDDRINVPASVFDDGSYDDCGIKSLLVQRMDPGCGCDSIAPVFDNTHYLGTYQHGDSLHYYYLSDFKTLGAKAKSLAKAMGGHVVVFETDAEWDQVNNWITPKTTDPYWIGLSDANAEGDFVWENGHPFNPAGFDVDPTPSNDVYPWSTTADGGTNPAADATTGDNMDCVWADPQDQFNWNDAGNDEEQQFVIEITNPCGLASYVPFCCADVDETVMVLFRVVDRWGNFNDCMVEMEVQDKAPLVIECPPDITVKCGYHYDDLSVFGTVAQDQASVGSFTIPSEYLVAPAANALWDGYVISTCDVNVVEQAPNRDALNQCGRGDLIRTFTAFRGRNSSVSCSQRITFDFDGTNYSIYDMTIADPGEITECMDINNTEETLDPEDYGYPQYALDANGNVIPETECDMVAYTFTDQVFPFNNQEGLACYKVIRTWKVIDWCNPCTFDDSAKNCPPEPRVGPFEIAQIFKINNKVAPALTRTFADMQFCAQSNDCSTTSIDHTVSATDDCTLAANLQWSYSVDYDYDGVTADYTFTNTGSGSPVTFVNDEGTTTFPFGTHLIQWSFEDACGNKVVEEQLVTIANCKAPTLACLDGLAIDLTGMGETTNGLFTQGMVEIWASDFAVSSSHTCGYEIVYSFSDDTTDGVVFYDCDDVANSPFEVDIYGSVIVGEGDNQQIFTSICTATIDIQNNSGIDCDQDGVSDLVSTDNSNNDDEDDDVDSDTEEGNASAIITGTVSTEDGSELQDVEVSLGGSNMKPSMTDNSGEYSFPAMEVGGAYAIAPQLDSDPTNGLSTLDIVLIQKHVLGLEQLPTPYKILAADVNNDKKITASDLVELRKMILGLKPTFDNIDSWRFVSTDVEFASNEDPLWHQKLHDYNIDNLNGNMDVDFTGIKVGDVNNSADVSDYTNTESRDYNQKLAFRLRTEQSPVNETVVSVPFIVDNDIQMSGMQFTIDFDADGLQFIDVEGREVSMTKSNVGTHLAEMGKLTLSWNTSESTPYTAGDNLFMLHFRVLKDKSFDGSFKINSDITEAQAYNEYGDIMEVEVVSDTNKYKDEQFGLLPNVPNPFKVSTTIRYTIPVSTSISFRIQDIFGKTVYSTTEQVAKGYNELTVDRSMLPAAGIYTYTIDSNAFTASKKMIVID